MQRTHPKQQASPLLQGVGGLLLLAATLLGIVGTIYRLVQPEGWLTAVASHGLPGGLVTFAALIGAGALVLVAPPRGATWRQNAFIYLFACAGAYYLVQFVTRGVL